MQNTDTQPNSSSVQNYGENGYGDSQTENKQQPITQKMGFGAGCFWGVQSVFDQINGITQSSVGFQGGKTINPSYKEVCYNDTGHAEVLEVDFDSSQVSVNKLLEVFFKNHNPTTKNRQGPDVGSQYRSVIFYYTKEQKDLADLAVLQLQQGMDGVGFTPSELNQNTDVFYQIGQTYRGKQITTEVQDGNQFPFYRAEDYHQKYFAKKGIVHNCNL
jgi:peptide-methionine (S)-S-oxide reductase